MRAAMGYGFQGQGHGHTHRVALRPSPRPHLWWSVLIALDCKSITWLDVEARCKTDFANSTSSSLGVSAARRRRLPIVPALNYCASSSGPPAEVSGFASTRPDESCARRGRRSSLRSLQCLSLVRACMRRPQFPRNDELRSRRAAAPQRHHGRQSSSHQGPGSRLGDGRG